MIDRRPNVVLERNDSEGQLLIVMCVPARPLKAQPCNANVIHTVPDDQQGDLRRTFDVAA